MKLHILILALSTCLISCNEENNQSDTTTTDTYKKETKPTPSAKEIEKKPTTIQKDTVTPISKPENKITDQEEIVEEKQSPQIKEDVIVETTTNKTIEKTAAEHKTTDEASIRNLYDNLLSKNVSDLGLVDYDALKKEQATLKTYISSQSIVNYSSLSKNDQLAFLINLYNALTLDLILTNYPLKSIKDIPNAWDTPVITLNGRQLSLNNIEHQLIRENFNEPRIHFACNCAATSCPKLLNQSYKGNILNQQLEMQTYTFLFTKSKNNISPNDLQLSKIFEWYGNDFGNVTEFIKKYRPEVNADAKVSYLEYDWSLNKK